MDRIAFTLMVVVLAGCNTAQTRDVNSPFYKIPPGSAIVLNKDLEIPGGQAHINLQDGVAASGIGQYHTSCTFNTRHLGPATIKADTFRIRETSSQQEWVSRQDITNFFKEFRLESDTQPDVINLVCQHWDGPMTGRPVSVPEMQKAVGDYVSFKFSQ